MTLHPDGHTSREIIASVASMVLTTESLVADEPEDPAASAAANAAMAGGGMGGMY